MPWKDPLVDQIQQEKGLGDLDTGVGTATRKQMHNAVKAEEGQREMAQWLRVSTDPPESLSWSLTLRWLTAMEL